MNRPTIVCLCGSTRFSEAFRKANLELTLAGKIVLSIGCDTKSDDGLDITEEQKAALDELHLRKIDLADEILFLNVGGYLGDSSKRELAYAIARCRRASFLEPAAGEAFMEDQAHEIGKFVAGFIRAPEGALVTKSEGKETETGGVLEEKWRRFSRDEIRVFLRWGKITVENFITIDGRRLALLVMRTAFGDESVHVPAEWVTDELEGRS